MTNKQTNEEHKNMNKMKSAEICIKLFFGVVVVREVNQVEISTNNYWIFTWKWKLLN